MILVCATFCRAEVVPPVPLVQVRSLCDTFLQFRRTKEDRFGEIATRLDVDLTGVDTGEEAKLAATRSLEAFFVDVLTDG